jgi:hypothetical protein
VFKDKTQNLVKEAIALPETVNDWYIRNMQRNEEMLAKIAADKLLQDDDKMGIKEVAMLILEVSLNNSKAINDSLMMQAKQLQLEALKEVRANEPRGRPPIMSNWDTGMIPLENLELIGELLH